MGRTTRAGVMLLPVALLSFLTACTSGRRVQPPPVFDPHKEQISILQKQLLELQNQQNETQRKVDALDARVSAVESQRLAPRTVQAPAGTAAAESVNEASTRKAPAAKKRTVKKRSSKRKKTR